VSAHENPTKSRREVLGLLGGLGTVIVVAGCSNGSDGNQSASSSSKATTTTTAATTGATAAAAITSCSKIPNETAGPFPGDGTNGPNILTEDGVVRRDITRSIGSASGVAEGVPLTVNLTIVDSGNGCVVMPGAAVYIWHCDREGAYSMYSGAAENENYLRGVQVADAGGALTFTTIFPAAYSGRWPHIHFEVFSSLAEATSGDNAVATSQLAFPKDVSAAVYATEGYEQSVRNLAGTSLDSDMVFSDGHSLQTPTMTGDVASGYLSSLVVGV
jgi:protocatechuate 3,4-dioxygenase beta subunit